VEVLARELWGVAQDELGSTFTWDEGERFPAQRAAMVAVAKHVLRKFEGKVYP